MELRGRILLLLHEESELEEIVRLVGMDALSAPDRLKMEAARSVREDFLQQDAFNETDMHASLEKEYLMMKTVLAYYDESSEGLKNGISIDTVVTLPVRERIGRFKYVPEAEVQEEYNGIVKELHDEISDAAGKKEES